MSNSRFKIQDLGLQKSLPEKQRVTILYLVVRELASGSSVPYSWTHDDPQHFQILGLKGCIGDQRPGGLGKVGEGNAVVLACRFPPDLRLLEAMYGEARALGVIAVPPTVEGLERGLRLARVLNVRTGFPFPPTSGRP
jgi:hypothetical protein